jgi:hypothetical protein
VPALWPPPLSWTCGREESRTRPKGSNLDKHVARRRPQCDAKRCRHNSRRRHHQPACRRQHERLWRARHGPVKTAATSTSSRARRRSPASSPASWARRSRSPCATRRSSSPPTATSRWWRSTTFRHRPDRQRNEMHVEMGDLTSGQELDVVFAHGLPLGRTGRNRERTVRAACRRSAFARRRRRRAVDVRGRWRRSTWRVRGPEATEHNREGRCDRARRVLEETARQIRRYAGNDSELRRHAHDLRE